MIHINKYAKCYYNNEIKYRLIRDFKLKTIANKTQLELALKHDQKFIITNWTNLYDYWFFFYSTLNEETKRIINNNIFKKLGKTDLILTYLIGINEAVTQNDEKLKIYMESFIQSGLIKDLTYNEKKKVFILTTNNNEKIKFSNIHKNKEDLNFTYGNCHHITNDILLHDDTSLKGVYAVTVTLNNYFNKPFYHSFIVKGKYVVDFAHNIIITFDDYKKLYNPTVIYKVSKNDLKSIIEKYNKTDIDFKNDTGSNLLKCAMHKQMKNKKKTN